MKQYVIDELRPEDYKALRKYLKERFGTAAVDGIYWIPVEPAVLTDIQVEHKECQPHHFAIDLGRHQLACELLVRAKNRIRCNCIQYATETQRNWLIEFIDSIFQHLKIIT
jgi:hypothetical protein